MFQFLYYWEFLEIMANVLTISSIKNPVISINFFGCGHPNNGRPTVSKVAYQQYLPVYINYNEDVHVCFGCVYSLREFIPTSNFHVYGLIGGNIIIPIIRESQSNCSLLDNAPNYKVGCIIQKGIIYMHRCIYIRQLLNDTNPISFPNRLQCSDVA